MKLNLILLFFVAVTGSLGAIYWKVDKDFYEQKIRWNESQSRAQISAISHSVETEIEGLTQVLDLAYPIVSEMQSDYNQEQVFSKFQMIARLQKAESGEWQLQNQYYLEKTPVRSWAKNSIFFTLKNLGSDNFEKAKVQVLQGTSPTDPEQQNWLFFITKSAVTQNLYATVISKDYFQSVVDRQKGQLGKISLINPQGQVIAHSTAEYIGMNLQEDEMVKEIMSTMRASGSGFFNGIEGERQHGFYAQVQTAGLFVAMETSISDLMSERQGLKKKFIFLGAGILFVGLAFLFFIEPSSVKNDELDSVIIHDSTVSTPIKSPEPTKQIAPEAHTTAKKELAAKEVKMMPPPPLGNEDVKTKAGFEQLFSERKIEEAFDMIDNLDSPPRHLKITEHVKQEPVQMPAAEQAPSRPSLEANEQLEAIAPIEKPLIQLKRRRSKLDEFAVEIRRPGQINTGEIL